MRKVVPLNIVYLVSCNKYFMYCSCSEVQNMFKNSYKQPVHLETGNSVWHVMSGRSRYKICSAEYHNKLKDALESYVTSSLCSKQQHKAKELQQQPVILHMILPFCFPQWPPALFFLTVNGSQKLKSSVLWLKQAILLVNCLLINLLSW